MLELLEMRRSIRRYQKRPIEKPIVDQLIQAALLAPSSRDLKPWEFVIVDDPGTLQQLSKAKPHSAAFLAQAPLGIVVLGNPARCDVWTEDCSIATFIIHLAATSFGLGSCWIQIRERRYSDVQRSGDYVKQILGVPEELEVEAIVAIGYPAEEKAARTAPALPQSRVHLNSFSKPY